MCRPPALLWLTTILSRRISQHVYNLVIARPQLTLIVRVEVWLK